MATCSSILAWRIPRTEEPGGLQSMGSPERHDSATEHTGHRVKNLLANAGDAGDAGSIPGPRRSPGVGNTDPFQLFLP